MRIQNDPPIHLTYCLNIHPGETWAENLTAIRDKALVVRDRVAPDGPFGLGLRLSHEAIQALAAPEMLHQFRNFLADNDLYAFTVNGFPYGRFHATEVKQNVYRPDWRTLQRRDYTNRLADVLASLLPDGVTGSISTVPGSYKAWIHTDEDVDRMVRHLTDVVIHLADVERRTGRRIVIGLEPEPDCFIENTAETIALFEGPLLAEGVAYVQQQTGVSADDAERAIRRHLGVCFDTCHLAVGFEDLATALRQLQAHGITIAKIHLSAAIRTLPTPSARERLQAFCDPVYLHQVRARAADGRLVTHSDLAPALQDPAVADCEDCRVHFHVPLFATEFDELESTAPALTPAFFDLVRSGITDHLEIETYTFDVLPEGMRNMNVTDSIAREYEWVLRRFGERGPS